MYVCMYVCMFVCMYVGMYVCMHVIKYVSMYVCVYVCMCVCMCVCMYIIVYINSSHDLNCIRGQEFRISHTFVDDGIKNFLFIISGEWRLRMLGLQ